MYRKAVSGIALFYVVLFISFWCAAALKVGTGFFVMPVGGSVSASFDKDTDETDRIDETNGTAGIQTYAGRYAESISAVNEGGRPEVYQSGDFKQIGQYLKESNEIIQDELPDEPEDDISINTVQDVPAESTSWIMASGTREKAEYVIDADEEDLEALCRIVEAEAGSEDEEGRILVANVVINRVNSKNFPDTIKEVVLQQKNGVAQFSPVGSGRYYDVEISEETLSAVEKALRGEDISEGALFFVARKRAKAESLKWFEDNLTFLFEHGGHEFYSY